jgi:hypothetical protein
MLGLAVVVIALLWAARSAGKAVAGNYRRHRDSWRDSHPDAGGLHHLAAMGGHLVSTLRHGPGAARAGFRQGWADGKERGRAWAARYDPDRFATPAVDPTPPTPPTPAPTRPTPPTPPPPASEPELIPGGNDPEPAPAPPVPAPAGRHLRPVPNPPASSNGGTTVPIINTATSGEVTGPESYANEAEAFAAEAASEVDDATADLARQQANLQRLERWHASMIRLEFKQDDIDVVAKMVDPVRQQVAQAQERVASANLLMNLANQAKENAAWHMQISSRAAGNAYAGR